MKNELGVGGLGFWINLLLNPVEKFGVKLRKQGFTIGIRKNSRRKSTNNRFETQGTIDLINFQSIQTFLKTQIKWPLTFRRSLLL